MKRRILTYVLTLCLIIAAFPVCTVNSQSAEAVSWDYYKLQSYDNDHSESVARGYWYSYEMLQQNFEQYSLAECYYGDESSRSLKLTTSVTETNTAHTMMFVNLYNSDFIGSAAGMRFKVANPSDRSIKMGITYCDNNAVYSCLNNGVYYLFTNEQYYRFSATKTWNDYCGGASDVGLIEIPSAFSGYIYIPFSSTTRKSEKDTFQRVRMTVGSDAGYSSTLYLAAIDYFSTSVDFSNYKTSDYSFDINDSMPESSASSAETSHVNVSFSSSIHDKKSGKSIKTVYKPANVDFVQWRINYLLGNIYDSSADGIKFWVKNPGRELKFAVQLGCSYTPYKIGYDYYLENGDGSLLTYRTTKQCQEDIGCITIPEQFEGYVYIPYSGCQNVTTGHLILGAITDNDVITVYFDSFQSYYLTDTDSISIMNFDNGVNYQNSVNGNTTLETTKGKYGNCIRAIARTDTDIVFKFNTGTDYKYYSDACGYRFFVSNPGNASVTFSVKGAFNQYILKQNFVYMIKNNGEIAEGNTVRADGSITLPAEFCGYIYLPFSAFSGSISATDADSAVIEILNTKIPSETSLDFDDFGYYYENPEVDGDINSDSIFNVKDLVRIKKFLSDKDIQIDTDIADLNDDNRLNSADAILTRKSLLFGIAAIKNELKQTGPVIQDNRLTVVEAGKDQQLCIATYDVVNDFYADNSGLKDATSAIKEALMAAECDGGGTVYMPAGKYMITGNLNIPQGVVLQGEWSENADKTVLLAENDSVFLTNSVITVSQSSGIRNMTILYPNQDINLPIQYDYSIKSGKGRCYTLENITVLGAWNGIQLGSEERPVEMYYLKNVRVSALNVGIYNNHTSDIGRMENVSCSPLFWTENVILEVSASKAKAIIEYCRQNSHGFDIYCNDWGYFYGISANNLSVGLYFGIADYNSRGTDGKFLKTTISDCKTGIYFAGVKLTGIGFTDLSITDNIGGGIGVDTGSEYSGTCMFMNAKIIGKFAYPVRNNGCGQVSTSGTLEFLYGEISGYSGNTWGVTVNGGSVVLHGIDFKTPGHHIQTSNKIQSLSVIGCTFAGGLESSIPALSVANCNIDYTPITTGLPDTTECERLLTAAAERPASNIVINVKDYGADQKNDDNTAAFTKALEALRGIGGTVYVPAGNWKFNGSITVPSGVELRGCSPVQQIQNDSNMTGTVFWVFADKGNAEGTPFINLEANAAISDFCTYYDEQNRSNATLEYPWTVKALGKSCRAQNVVLSNSYNGMDFGSCNTDDFYISFVFGAPLKTGIFVGNSSTGYLSNCHFNPNFSYIMSHNAGNADFRLYNADAYKIGNVDNLLSYGLFAFGYNNGIKFISQNGSVCNGTLIQFGTDGSENSVRICDAGNINFVNPQLVAMASVNEKHNFITESTFKGIAKVWNASVWGPTDILLSINGGECYFNLVNICTAYGTYGMRQTAGSTNLNAVCFHNTNILISGKDTNSVFFGCFTRGYQKVLSPVIQDDAYVILRNSLWA